METQLATDSTLSGLDLLFKEQLVTDQNLVLKVNGVFSTVSGLRQYAGSLHKYFAYGRRGYSTKQFKRDKSQFKLGAGVSYRSDLNTDVVTCGLTAKKQFGLGIPDTWLKLLSKLDYNTKTQEVAGLGRLQLTKSIYNFTDTQDVRLRIGYEAFVDQKGNIVGKPFGQLRENNWSFNTNFSGWWGVRYDL